MPGLVVSRKVKLLGSWNEDIFTDDIVQAIATLARSEKGKTVKVVLSQKGVKLTRSKLFQESKTTLFPIQDLRTVTRSPDFSQCVLLILSNVHKKYKIIALGCASEKDAVHLISGFAEIQKSLQSSHVELKKKKNGNWTLRERFLPRSRKRVKEVFTDHQPNGEIVTGSENGAAKTHRPATDTTDGLTSATYQKGVYTKRNTSGDSNSYRARRKKGYDIDGNVDDDFVIETEVLMSPQATTDIHTRQHSDDIRKHKTGAEYASLKIPQVDNRRVESSRHLVHSEQNSTPGVVYSTKSRSVVSSQPVFSREPTPRTYSARMETPVVYYRKSKIPEVDNRRLESGRHYVHSGQNSTQSPFVVYTATSRSTVSPQAVFSREPSHKTYEARIEPPASLRGRGRGWGSMQSDTLPVRVWGGNWNMTFDQRSVRSNTSKSSHSRKKKSSDFYYPTTIVRPIEDTYPRPPLVFRRGTDQIIAYRPGADNYYVVEAGEPQMYPDDGVHTGRRH